MIVTDATKRFRVRVAVELAEERLMGQLATVAAECGMTYAQVEDHLYAIGCHDLAGKWAAWAEVPE